MNEGNQTLKLYETDGYVRCFEAQVIQCEKTDGGYEVVLDKTAFFPEGGGQEADTGVIEVDGRTIKVGYVRVKDGVIYHVCDSELASGMMIKGRIDWDKRFSNMQQHSGEHILSGIIHRKFGYDNVGFHMGSQVVTLDLNGPLTQADIDQVELESNIAIYENRRINILYPDRSELTTMDYRSKIDIEGQVRIVEIEGYDMCACCAPHVNLTGEIGLLKIVSWQKYKGGVRISILCGKRAFEYCNTNQRIVNQLSNQFSANQDTVIESINKLNDELIKAKQELSSLKKDIMGKMIEQIDADQNNVCLFTDGIDANDIRDAVNQLTKSHPGFCGIFDGSDEDGYRYIIGSLTLDARDIGNKLKESFECRGGGSKLMIQGQISGKKAEIMKAFD